MITIPLAPVYAYLARHDAAGALDGAPLLYDRMGPRLKAIDPIFLERLADGIISDTHSLYLGSGPVCPAALGWVSVCLSLMRTPPADLVWPELQRRELLRWLGEPSTTDAARLRAVLLHEMGRA